MGLSSLEKGVLLDLARGAVRAFIQDGFRDEPDPDIGDLPEALKEKKGLFVAILEQGQPRGCMGTILPVMPVWQACRENARFAAYKDPRFAPLTAHELKHIRFEITILNKPRPLRGITQLKRGVHGIILTTGFRKEVFLPGSLTGLPGDIDAVFAHLRAKAEVLDDHEALPERWEIFDAEVVSEADY